MEIWTPQKMASIFSYKNMMAKIIWGLYNLTTAVILVYSLFSPLIIFAIYFENY